MEPARDAETIRARTHARSFALRWTENCGPQLGDPVWLALRTGLIVEKDFEREIANAFGRERNARRDSERAAYRNECRTGDINTAEAPWKYSAPQVCEATERFGSSVWSSALRGQAGADNN